MTAFRIGSYAGFQRQDPQNVETSMLSAGFLWRWIGLLRPSTDACSVIPQRVTLWFYERSRSKLPAHIPDAQCMYAAYFFDTQHLEPDYVRSLWSQTSTATRGLLWMLRLMQLDDHLFILLFGLNNRSSVAEGTVCLTSGPRGVVTTTFYAMIALRLSFLKHACFKPTTQQPLLIQFQSSHSWAQRTRQAGQPCHTQNYQFGHTFGGQLRNW